MIKKKKKEKKVRSGIKFNTHLEETRLLGQGFGLRLFGVFPHASQGGPEAFWLGTLLDQRRSPPGNITVLEKHLPFIGQSID